MTEHEHDRETNYENMEARLYDSNVVRFTTLDPLSNQYPSTSSYAYVLGNPVLYTDPNGKEIRVYYKEGGEEKYVIYRNGGFVVPGANPGDETVYNGNNQFLADVKASLLFLEKSPTGKALIDNLASASAAEFTLQIFEGDISNGAFNFGIVDPPNAGSIYYNPNLVTVDLLNGTPQIPAITLLHELGHANGALNLFRANGGANATPRSVWAANEDRTTYSSGYDNKEEERVIRQIETPVIMELKQKLPQQAGLNTRESHFSLEEYESRGPLSIVKPNSVSPKPKK